MTPFELLEGAVKATQMQWWLLVLLLPIVGRAVASSWGPGGVLAAQRALLILFVDFLFGLVVALPTHAWPFLLASLPVMGAALFQRERPRPEGKPLAWIGALAFSIPAITLNHMGPYDWAVAWFLGILGFAMFRGIVDPAFESARNLPRQTGRPPEKPSDPHPDND